jgi:type II secretory pathway component PulC
MRSHPRRTARLLAASAALAGIVAFEFFTGPFFVPDPPQEGTSINVAADTPVTPLAERPDISEFAEVTARPLFSPSRRPYEPAEEPKVDSAANTQNFDLIGITIFAGERSALLRPKASKQGLVRVVEGQIVGGWEVRVIDPAQVTLARPNSDQESTVLTINERRSKYAGSNLAVPQKQTIPQASREEPSPNNASPEGTKESTPEQ